MGTGLGPEKTSFFQALNIPTKIQKGTIEIVQDVNLIKEGDKVGMSEATLLNMLGISPFTYGLVIRHVYDSGTIFASAPHSIVNGLKKCLALAAVTDITFKEAEKLKEYLADPSKFAAAAAAAAPAAAAPAAKKEEKKEESEEEDDDMGFGLFD